MGVFQLFLMYTLFQMPLKSLNQESKQESNNITILEDLILRNPIFKKLKPSQIIKNKYGIDPKKNSTWEDFIYEINNKDLETLKGDILEILEQRKKLTWDVSHVSGKYLEEANTCIEELESSKYNTAGYLGRGMAGIIFVQNNVVDCCVKYLHDPSKTKNSIPEEFSLLNRAAQLQLENLKIPRAHFLLTNIDVEKSIYTMNKIKGVNFEQIFDSVEHLKNLLGEKYDDFCKKMNDPSFLQKLQDDLSIIHKNGIIHADIHQRNIMVDKNGDINLIDFGNSIDLYKTDAPYETLENLKNQDLVGVELLVKELRKKLLLDK